MLLATAHFYIFGVLASHELRELLCIEWVQSQLPTIILSTSEKTAKVIDKAAMVSARWQWTDGRFVEVTEFNFAWTSLIVYVEWLHSAISTTLAKFISTPCIGLTTLSAHKCVIGAATNPSQFDVDKWID